jgi:hypothetical protein
LVAFVEGPEGVKLELGFVKFWLGKWDFMHWDWDSSAKKQWKMGLRFDWD